ncbi:MAG: hypothetical protein KBF88_04280 [Polyangiaceae bacterium]|nr:hypothetical protein [Polyangiaceae bacterium]
MSSARRALSVLAAAATCAGCSVLLDSSGLMEGTGNSMSDVGRDGSASDSAPTTTTDSGSPIADSAPEPTSPSAFDCTKLSTLFCSSFSGALIPEWDNFGAFGGGNGGVDTTFSLSAPGSLRGSVPRQSSGSGGYNVFKAIVGVTKTSLEYGFSFYNDSATDLLGCGLAEIHLGKSGRFIHLITYSSILQLQASSANVGFVDIKRTPEVLQRRTWHKVVLRVARGTSGTVSLEVDNVDHGSVAFGIDADTSGAIDLVLGPYFQGTGSAASNIHFDNVYLR